MPLFTFLCRTCESTSEILVRGESKPVCPACGGHDLIKQASAIRALSSAPEPVAAGCGASACCQMPGGCGLN